MRPSMSLELKARVTRSIRDLEKKVEEDEGRGGRDMVVMMMTMMMMTTTMPK
jgi:hypothetical protein